MRFSRRYLCAFARAPTWKFSIYDAARMFVSDSLEPIDLAYYFGGDVALHAEGDQLLHLGFDGFVSGQACRILMRLLFTA